MIATDSGGILRTIALLLLKNIFHDFHLFQNIRLSDVVICDLVTSNATAFTTKISATKMDKLTQLAKSSITHIS